MGEQSVKGPGIPRASIMGIILMNVWTGPG